MLSQRVFGILLAWAVVSASARGEIRAIVGVQWKLRGAVARRDQGHALGVVMGAEVAAQPGPTFAARLNEAAVVRIPSAYGVPEKPNSLANLLESKR